MTQVQTIETRSREQWVDIINTDWRKSIEGIIQTGNDLIQAKKELPNGQFGFMINEDLFFSPRTAQRLMHIARHPEIGKCDDVVALPHSWAVLNELTKLSPEDFREARDRGLIGPETTARQARKIAADVRDPEVLPVPSEARRMASETGKFVAASDGNIYSGASEAEASSAVKIRDQTYAVIDAIDQIFRMPDAAAWLAEAESWQLREFDKEKAEAAVQWLNRLLERIDGGK